jgi:hypothetical protein
MAVDQNIGSATKPTTAAVITADQPEEHRLAAFKQILTTAFGAAVLYIVILLALFFVSLFWGIQDSAPSPVLTVILAGGLGAVFSSLIRLYNYTDLPKALSIEELKGLKNLHLFIYSLTPVIVGSIAATVFYVLIAGRILEGPLFAEFFCKNPNGSCSEFSDLLNYWSPKEAIDYAKAIVWGFVAGFAERLVPNAIDGLALDPAQKK